MNVRTRKLLLSIGLLVVVGAAIILITSGDGGEAGAEAFTGETWAEQADGYCSDGLQEATALTPPSSARQVAADANARIAIVATVRDGIYTLGEPEDADQALAAVYVDQLNSDLDELAAIADAAKSGGDYQSLSAGFDESSGQTADRLGLADCAAFSEAIARTP